MIMFIHNTCMGLKGMGNPIIDEEVMVNIAPMLVDNWNRTKRRMLSNMVRPSRTALIMVAKLSSCRSISADSFATSVPLPMATPIAAFLSAGASLTPSPVMDATLPVCLRASTMRTFCSGNTLAYTLISLTMSRNSSLLDCPGLNQ